jgi:hypothetical protein
MTPPEQLLFEGEEQVKDLFSKSVASWRDEVNSKCGLIPDPLLKE